MSLFRVLCVGSNRCALLERCPNFSGWYIHVQVSMEPDDVFVFFTFQKVLCTGFMELTIYITVKSCQYKLS